MNTPFPNDFPPCLSIGLETGKEANGGGGFRILSSNYLRIYNIREAKTAPYQTIQPHIAALEKLLKRRPALAPNSGKTGKEWKQERELPDYPPRNAGHLIEAKFGYLDAPWGSGVMYITQFVQGMGETPNNEQLVCIFQGISKAKHRYISADFQVSHPSASESEDERFDWRKPGEQEAASALCKKIERTVDSASDESFTPSLRAIREWLSRLQME